MNKLSLIWLILSIIATSVTISSATPVVTVYSNPGYVHHEETTAIPVWIKYLHMKQSARPSIKCLPGRRDMSRPARILIPTTRL